MIDYLFKGISVLSLVLVAGLYFGSGAQTFGGVAPTTTFTSTILADQGIRVGSSTATTVKIGKVIPATCNLIGMNASHLASTSQPYDCSVTGARPGDMVWAQLATSSQTSLSGGWIISDAKASTTNNYITVRVVNLTGGDAVPSASRVGSSTQVLIVRNY